MYEKRRANFWLLPLPQSIQLILAPTANLFPLNTRVELRIAVKLASTETRRNDEQQRDSAVMVKTRSSNREGSKLLHKFRKVRKDERRKEMWREGKMEGKEDKAVLITA